MKSTVAVVGTLLFVAMLATSPPALAKKKPKADVCPSRYSLVGEICISSRTGDVVLPQPH